MTLLNIKQSKLRSKLLQFYFSHPEKEYYLRQLERLLEQPVAYIRRELLNLEEEGIFLSQMKGRQKYFRLNKDYPLYEEIKKIVFKTIGVAGSLKTVLQKIGNIQIAFIFGSFASKKEDSKSDIDLMIIGNPKEDELISLILRLEKKLAREINYRIYTKKDLKEKAKQKDSFIESVLGGSKIFLIGSKDELQKSYC